MIFLIALLTSHRVSDATHLFVVGIGAAYASIIELFKANERYTNRVDKVFMFIDKQPLHSCRSATDDDLSNWYYHHSLVCAAAEHNIWEYTSKKPKKRFGTLVRSDRDNLQEMLLEQWDKVTGTMADLTADWQNPDTTTPKEDPMSSEDELSPRKIDAKEASLRTPAASLPMIGNFASSPRGRTSPGKR